MPWPSVGDTLSEGTVIGRIEPRFTPLERLDLAARLAQAKADARERTAALAAARASLEGKKKLNTEHGMVSERTLEEAEAKVKEEEARLSAAEQIAELLESWLSSTVEPADLMPIRADRDGQVAGVFAQPGEVLESGQPILRTADFG